MHALKLFSARLTSSGTLGFESVNPEQLEVFHGRLQIEFIDFIVCFRQA